MPPKKDKKAPNRSRGANWTEVETKTLIDVLRENFLDFRKAKRKNGVYEKMWIEMQDRGVQRSLKQIKDRHKVLHNKFKSEKKEHSGTGSSPSEWPYYEACASFMDSIPLNDHETVDTLEEIFTGKRSTQVKDAADKPSTSYATSPHPEIEEDDFESGKGAETSEKEDESETVRKNKDRTKDPLVLDQTSDNSEEEEELETTRREKRPAKNKIVSSEEENDLDAQLKKKVPAKKRPRVSVIEIITEEMQASREASSSLAQTLNNTLTGFTPFLQNLGASLQMLPQLLQQQPTPPPTPFHYNYPPQYPGQFNHSVPFNQAPVNQVPVNQVSFNQGSFNQGPFNQGHALESQRYPAGPAIQPEMSFNPNAIPNQNNHGNEPPTFDNETYQQL